MLRISVHFCICIYEVSDMSDLFDYIVINLGLFKELAENNKSFDEFKGEIKRV